MLNRVLLSSKDTRNTKLYVFLRSFYYTHSSINSENKMHPYKWEQQATTLNRNASTTIIPEDFLF